MQTVKDTISKLTGQTALAKESLILVTGASGYIGSHVVNEALEAGYKVRGTARSQEKCDATKKTFKNHPNYSTAIVADFQHDGAFDEATQGVHAVIHVASDTTFGSDPNQVIKPTVAGVLSILKSAKKAGTVKRFVLTSSSTAAFLPHPGKEITYTAKDWDQEALDIAWAPPPYNQDRAFPVYGASKTEAERAFWKFIEEEKPGFVGNSVLPNFNMGRILSSPGATGGGVLSILKGEVPGAVPQYMIDVIDDARLRVIAAALDPSLENERIFAFNVPFNWTDIIAIVKELRPSNTTTAKAPENEERDLSKVPNEVGAKLLKKWYGQDGYKPIKQSVAENLEGAANN